MWLLVSFRWCSNALVSWLLDASRASAEIDRAVELIRSMTEGKTLVMVEHDMSVVFGLADVISVVVYGELIASDRPERIRANKAVQEAYLGTEAA